MQMRTAPVLPSSPHTPNPAAHPCSARTASPAVTAHLSAAVAAHATASVGPRPCLHSLLQAPLQASRVQSPAVAALPLAHPACLQLLLETFPCTCSYQKKLTRLKTTSLCKQALSPFQQLLLLQLLLPLLPMGPRGRSRRTGSCTRVTARVRGPA